MKTPSLSSSASSTTVLYLTCAILAMVSIYTFKIASEFTAAMSELQGLQVTQLKELKATVDRLHSAVKSVERFQMEMNLKLSQQDEKVNDLLLRQIAAATATAASSFVQAPQIQSPIPAPKPFPLQKGVDYIADYDIEQVWIDPLPQPKPGAKPFKFQFLDPNVPANPPFRYVSNWPRVGLVPNFLSSEECEQLIALGEPQLIRSTVIPHKGSEDFNKTNSAESEVRTSSQTWLSNSSSPTREILQRLLNYLHFPPQSHEQMQMLRYESTQKYIAHHDYFDPAWYGPQTSQRAVTILMYLSDVEEGGETQFPRADGKPETTDFRSCIAGLKVRPRKGTMTFFYDLHPNGDLEPYSLHGGCPVVKGLKFVTTVWLRVPTS